VGPLAVAMTSSFVKGVIVNVVVTGIVVAVDDTMIVSRIVIGTVTVWIVAPSENDVPLIEASSCLQWLQG
jgi:hypothetical protein